MQTRKYMVFVSVVCFVDFVLYSGLLALLWDWCVALKIGLGWSGT
jgi:hypothetical protein